MSPCGAPVWLTKMERLAGDYYDEPGRSYGDAAFNATLASGDLWRGLFGELVEHAEGARPEAEPGEVLAIIQHAYPEIFRQIVDFAGHVSDREWNEAKRAVELAVAAVDKAGGPDCVMRRLRDGANSSEGRKLEAEA